MPEIQVRGIRLSYEAHGRGQPILCIHGGGSSALLWADAIGPLAQLGRVIAYDRRGCGRSQRPTPYLATTVQEQADDAAGLLEALGAPPAVVIGRSYGGEIALELARRRPQQVRALVLLDASPLQLDAEAQRWGEALTSRIQQAALHAPQTVGEILIRVAVGDGAWEALPAVVRELFTANGPAIVAEFKGGTADLDEVALATIYQPTLVVSAADSPAPFRRVSERLAAALPTVEAVRVQGGHLIDPAHPVVLGFIQRQLSAAGR